MATTTATTIRLDSHTRTKAERIRDTFGKIQQRPKEWLHSGKWLRAGIVRYTDPEGKENVWEMVERTTKSAHDGGTDGVDVEGEIYTYPNE